MGWQQNAPQPGTSFTSSWTFLTLRGAELWYLVTLVTCVNLVMELLLLWTEWSDTVYSFHVDLNCRSSLEPFIMKFCFKDPSFRVLAVSRSDHDPSFQIMQIFYICSAKFTFCILCKQRVRCKIKSVAREGNKSISRVTWSIQHQPSILQKILTCIIQWKSGLARLLHGCCWSIS